jgi:hypothetical protein
LPQKDRLRNVDPLALDCTSNPALVFSTSCGVTNRVYHGPAPMISMPRPKMVYLLDVG